VTRLVLFRDVLAKRDGTCPTCRRPVVMLLVASGPRDYLTARQQRDWVACDHDRETLEGIPRHVCVPKVSTR